MYTRTDQSTFRTQSNFSTDSEKIQSGNCDTSQTESEIGHEQLNQKQWFSEDLRDSVLNYSED